ncbi:MAG: YdcF family protein [Akkermansia sp.]|nr:YdcF family protein [Akkermansia sp.]
MDALRKRSRLRTWLRRLALTGGCAVAALLVLIGVAELWTWGLSGGKCHDTPAACRADSVGLVLGCSKYIRRGYRNYFYIKRMEAAAELWKSGRVRCLIVSGDNRAMNYNEPRDMRNSLISLGVPADRIVCDFAGICTYDSVVRANRIFGADHLIIVSQESHAERAVAIARHLGIDAEGLNARRFDITRRARLRAWLRERAARVAMLYDFLTNRTPRHLGKPEPLPY